jgi:uncharacterized protein (DUF433 family)
VPEEEMTIESTIINRGRGPEIAGTRITVYDIWDYAKQNWHRDAIAATLRLSSAQAAAALEYIDQHKDEVLAEYAEILGREARGNPPELQSKLDATHAKFQARLAERRKQQESALDERIPGGP